jgi:hypothetical protein
MLESFKMINNFIEAIEEESNDLRIKIIRLAEALGLSMDEICDRFNNEIEKLDINFDIKKRLKANIKNDFCGSVH